MRRVAPVVVLILFMVAEMTAAPLALADHDGATGTGSLDGGYVGSKVHVPNDTGGGKSGGGGSSAPSATPVSQRKRSGRPSPYRWSREYITEYPQALRYRDDPNNTPGIVLDPGPTPTCTGPNGEEGRPYRDQLIDTRDGSVVSTWNGCYVPGSGNPEPPLPPEPPTEDEILEAAPLPRMPFGISPSGRDCRPTTLSVDSGTAPSCPPGESPGLTGLETLLWVEPAPPAEVSVTASIRGYTVVTRAHATRYTWHMRQDGDTESSRNPDPAITSDTPGSRAAPAARYTYETKGDYHVSLTITWQGSYTFSGNDVPAVTDSLGPVEGDPYTSPFHVIEVRAVLTGA